MSPHPLDGVRAKLDRAHKHVDELDAEAKAWLQYASKPVLNINIEGDWEVAQLGIPQEPPLRLAVIAGDVIHNTRSALDHLVWQLVDQLKIAKPGGHNYFPIALNNSDFNARVHPAPRKGRTPKGALDGIPPSHDAYKIIAGHQPYARWDPNTQPGPEHDFLAILNRMWNIDKHRMLYTGVLASPQDAQEILDMFEWDAQITLLEQKVNSTLLADSFKDGQELARFRLAGPGAKPHLRSKGTLPGHIMHGYEAQHETSFRLGTRGTTHFIWRVEAVLKDLERFF